MSPTARCFLVFCLAAALSACGTKSSVEAGGGGAGGGGAGGDAEEPLCAEFACDSPPSDVCEGESLRVHASRGHCEAGACSYESTLRECEHGCEGGACKASACADPSCDAPPADDCKDDFTARRYAEEGSCDEEEGRCSYLPTEQPCPYGCLEGACLICAKDEDCDAGHRCSGNECLPCDMAQHCGPSCTACPGETPVCEGGACACTEDSCGPGHRCSDGACIECASPGACGSSCSPCGDDAPLCLDEGDGYQCLGCRDDADCHAEERCESKSRTCVPCPAEAVTVFADDFALTVGSWAKGADVHVGDTPWRAYSTGWHGVRILGGRLTITNMATNNVLEPPEHGQGHAYVKTGGAGSHYDSSLYRPVLKENTQRDVIWSFNMRRQVFSAAGDEDGGFDCSLPEAQNKRTIGLAYVLATDSAEGLLADPSTCDPSASSSGYAVVLGGGASVRLVKFRQGLRNGVIDDLIQSDKLERSVDHLSVRVRYRAETDAWKLEVRSDGSEDFADPAAGAYDFSGTAVDATYVDEALPFSGPYFQTGCTWTCYSRLNGFFDNVKVAVQCSP